MMLARSGSALRDVGVPFLSLNALAWSYRGNFDPDQLILARRNLNMLVIFHQHPINEIC
jgi:hypothetical protein